MASEKFKLIEDLGGGGFARTYKAEVLDKELCKKWSSTVVIKIPHNKIKEKNILKEAFKYERLKDVESEYIVNYLDIELYKGQYVLVLSYVDAVSLEELIRNKKRLQLDVILTIIEQCCTALVATEKLNILHRDIDPSNILICRGSNKAKLTDFGISEILKNADQSCVVTGKFHYMAPEVFEGKASFDSDIYALGVTFYRLLTGGLPYDDKDNDLLVKKIIKGNPVDPIKLNNNIDQELNRVVLKSIHHDRKQRYQNAKELLGDLLNYKNSKDQKNEVAIKIQEAWDNFNNANASKCKSILVELNKKYDKETLTYIALGEFYNKIDDFDKAIAVFLTGLQKVNDDAMLYKDLSVSYMKKGDFAKAVDALEKAGSLGLDSKAKEQALKLLKSLSSKTKGKEKRILVLGIVKGPNKGHKFIFSSSASIIIGRAETADIPLSGDQFVSRKHGIIKYENGKFTIEDTKSKNGIFVNEEEIDSITLEDGDTIKAGNTYMSVSIKTIQGYLLSKNK